MLIGYNYSPEPTGIGKYSGEMINWLAEKGYNCTVITTYPYYPFWKVQDPYRSKRFWFNTEKKRVGLGSIKVIRCPIYVPNTPSGLKRIILDTTFLFTSLLALLKVLFNKKIDVVMAVAPTFFTGFPALLYKWLKGSKVIYHIQDLQIEAASELGMIKSKPLIKFLFGMEKFILNRVDVVSSISEAMIDRISLKTHTKSFFLPNWTDTEYFKPEQVTPDFKEKYEIDPNNKVVLYSGAVGKKQGLECIIKSAALFTQEKVTFIICGSGPFLEDLQALADNEGLSNILFLPLQDISVFNSFLNMADVHLVVQKSGAGDLLLPSKLTSILAVGGLPLITANHGTTLFSLTEKYDLGISVEAEHQEAFDQGLKIALEDSELNKKKRKNARSYALKFLNKSSILQNFDLLISKEMLN